MNSIKLGPKFVEALLIVVSILLAFAIDAWWDERKDRVEELKILLALTAEFKDNLEQLETIIEFHNVQRGIVEAVERLSEEEVRALPQQSHSEFIFALCTPFTFNAVLGTTNALIGSGKMELIEDFKLRVALTRFLQSYEDSYEDADYMATNHKLTWPLEAQLGGPWTDRSVELGAEGEEILSLEFTPLPTADDVIRILADQRFMGLIKRCHINVGYYLTELETMREQAEDILTLIEQSLDGR